MCFPLNSTLFSCNDLNSSLYPIQVISTTNILYDTYRKNQFAVRAGTLEEINELLAPSYIVIPLNDLQVQDIAIFAYTCNYTLVVRSGGHQVSIYFFVLNNAYLTIVYFYGFKVLGSFTQY